MNLRAAVYMLISSAAFAAMYLIAKRFQHYGGFELTFFRGLGTAVLAAGYLLVKGIPLRGNDPKWLALRGITGGASLVLFFLAIAYVPITAAVAIRYLAPLFAILFSMYFLRDRVQPVQWLFFALAFAGVVLLKGFDGRIGGVGLALILASALLAGVTFTIIRKLGTSEHPLVIVFYFTGTSTVIGLLGILSGGAEWVQPVGLDWAYLLSLGVVGFVGQIFMTVAMQTESADAVMPLKYFEAVFLLVLSYFLLGEAYGPLALAGMGLILAGNLANVLHKRRAQRASA